MTSVRESHVLVLASVSTWRRQVLEAAGYDFQAIDPAIDEKAIRAPDPETLTTLIAQAKVRAVLPKLDRLPALVVAADQVVQFHGRVREKPNDAEEARRFLRDYRGQAVELVTGMAVLDTATAKCYLGQRSAFVTFGALPDDAIEQAIARGDVLRSCGAVVVEDSSLAPWIREIDGSDDCVRGLPLDALERSFRWHDHHGHGRA